MFQLTKMTFQKYIAYGMYVTDRYNDLQIKGQSQLYIESVYGL